jgi:hypothetical protein
LVLIRFRRISMRKSARTPQELNAMLLAELRRVPGCEGAAWVGIYMLRKHIRGRNWLAAFFNPGTADKQACARAMPGIEARLQVQFDAVEPRRRSTRERKFLGYRGYHRRMPTRFVPEGERRQHRGATAMFSSLAVIRKLLTPSSKQYRARRLIKQT